MTFKRFIAVTLALLLLLGALPGMLPAALAKPNEYGCPNTSNGKHDWDGARYREPWCEWAGGYIYVCRKCHKEVFEETAPALGHKWPEWTVTKEPTCTQKGSRTRTCNRCHKVETQEMDSLGHSFTKPWTTVKLPTCEDAGQEVNYCVRCGYEWRREIHSYGHNWDEGVITKEPTATDEGERTFTCKRDPSHTRTEPIPATGITDPKPSLKLELNSCYVNNGTYDLIEYISLTQWSSHYASFVLNMTVTNTGNVPLNVKQVQAIAGANIEWSWDAYHKRDLYYQSSDIFALQPGESCDVTGEYPLNEWSYSEDYYIDNISGKIVTFADATNEYITLDGSVYYIGYPTYDFQSTSNGYSDSKNTSTPMCESNTCAFRLQWSKPINPLFANGDFCLLLLEGLSDTGAYYTLHTCSEHLETAESSETLALAGDWAGAAELWRGEVGKLYETLKQSADTAATEVLDTDREALFAYADAVQALYGDEAAANLLRLRCAAMCCMLNTAPNDLRLGLLGQWTALDTDEAFELSGREIGSLRGTNSPMIERYASSVKEAMANTVSLIDPASDPMPDDVFSHALVFWKTVLDGIANQAYKAVDKDAKALIANWRMSLTMLCEADEEFYALFYADDMAMTEELLMDLYKDAALLADSIR